MELGLGLWFRRYSELTIQCLDFCKNQKHTNKTISISEISTPSDRGMLLSSYQVVIQGLAVVGFWAAYATNALIANTSDLQWQLPVSIQLVPGLMLLLGTLFIGETPHYIATKGTLQEVVKSLSWFRGLPASDASVRREASDIFNTVQSGTRRKALRKTSFLREAFTNPIRKRLIVGVGLFILQNMSGMNALNYYVAVIFITVGFKDVSTSLFLTGIFGLVKVAAALLFMFVCVRISGNRFWLIWGSLLCAASMFVLGYCIATADDSSQEGGVSVRAIISVLSVYAYTIAFGISKGPIAWNICSEIFPLYVNAQCCAITTDTQWLFQAVVAAITPILLASIGPMTFVFFGVWNLIGTAFYYFCVPETRGVALGTEMSRAFGQEDKKDVESEGAVEEVEDIDAESDEDGYLAAVETPLFQAERKRRRRR